MNLIKPIVGLLFFIGLMSLWIFQVYNNSRVNEDILEQKINSIDSKINDLESEISFLSIEQTK